MNQVLRIIVADDHAIVRHGIRLAAEASRVAQVVAEAANSDELIAAVQAQSFDAIVTDYAMPGERTQDGIALIDRLMRMRPNVPIVVVTAMRNVAILNKLISKGISGIVEKAGGVHELQAALLAVVQERHYVSPGIQSLLASASIVGSRVGKDATLTTAELEVVRLFAREGLTPNQISQRLNRSVKTISRHKMNAQRKLGLATNQDLLEYCRKHDISAV
ncbi:response regulator [Trinickia caryophylli]|uniref:Two-component system, NarL family, captular synthesis response regulator RcsB n=1 Tax=Trinickia caryophylli TaxID=28094 RepID=A0A1X7DZQ1_TRICW|nr:response regulator [Trinickia caryophylli]WQE11432.1 response regulator [Trinickia caryophylli]GLU32596.1 DNA-binding response regulator [Trinickia caryophylli]SMF24804.1 two-component system, NarL family, captular synthesis response regulator RcsB [Trinickia caryophylli]